MNSQFGRYVEQVQRRWWVVVLVIAFCVTATAMLADDRPSYVGKALLVQSSPGHSPEQDATMAVGYSTLFNEPATISRLRDIAEIPEAVTFVASTVAASPILTIEATAEDPELAQAAAQRMAQVFREDINSARHSGYARDIQEAERQLQSAQSHPQPDGSMNPLVPVLQARLDAMRDNGNNQLQDLQLQAGVTKTDPKLALQLLSGTVGGLFLGILAALGLAAMSPRIANCADLLDKTGVVPLVEVPGGGSYNANKLQENQLRILANLVSVQDLPKSAVFALSDCHGVRGAKRLAEHLARLSAQQGRQTVLVYADNDVSEATSQVGFNDALADSGLVNDALQDGPMDALRILRSGSFVADRYPLMSRERIEAVLDELRVTADAIIIAAPSLVDPIDASPLCAAADFTILVVGKRSSRSGDVISAADALTDAHATLLGAVLTGKINKGGDSPKVKTRHTADMADRATDHEHKR
jgi:Mrp family chromosome partitioning ATPase/capsular polysaccharide biosynthesis protein